LSVPRSGSPPDSAEIGATATELPAHWKSLLAPYERPSTTRSVVQLLTTAALFVAGWWAMLRTLEISYWITLLAALLEGALLIRLFIIFHDCVHGSFFRSRAANDLVGRILGVLTLTPYEYWRRNHLLHHATSGNLDRRGYGDVDTLTVREYLARSNWGRACYRFSRNPWVYLVLGPPYLFLLKHRLPLGMPLAWRREWRSILFNNLALGLVVWAMSRAVGLGTFVSIQAPVFLVSTVTGIWLFYVQHQFAGTYWQRDGRWDYAAACMTGSSFLDLPVPLRWATANIEVHHIHHLCSTIPNYRLRRCMQEVVELPAPRRLTLRESFRCARLALWDEQDQRLVSFRQVTCAASSPASRPSAT